MVAAGDETEQVVALDRPIEGLSSISPSRERVDTGEIPSREVRERPQAGTFVGNECIALHLARQTARQGAGPIPGHPASYAIATTPCLLPATTGDVRNSPT